MSLSLSSLLNPPGPDSEQSTSKIPANNDSDNSSKSNSRHNSDATYPPSTPVTTTTTIINKPARSLSGASSSPSTAQQFFDSTNTHPTLPSPRTILPQSPTRSVGISSYGKGSGPVEPSPPLEAPSYSPGLEQYHHASFPDQQRRASWIPSRMSPPPKLAPIQSIPLENPPIKEKSRSGKGTTKRAENTSGIIHQPPSDLDISNSGLQIQLEQSKDTTLAMSQQLSEVHIPETSAAPTTQEAKSEYLPTMQPVEVKHEPTIETTKLSQLTSEPLMDGSVSNPTDDKTQNPDSSTLHVESASLPRAPSVESATPIRSSPAPMTKPLAASVGKKRAAPGADKKKGVARKPAPKKRKLDADNLEGGTPSSRRSATPASSRASRTPAPKTKKQRSVSVAETPPPTEEHAENTNEDGDVADAEEGDELFCICRRPDNHTWMIGCDGGCEDWFHGRCVNIKEEDGDLIDKYICPNCEEAGKGFTTWKRVCRLPSCRKPARLIKNNLSKYCCDEHGKEFMRRKVRKLRGGDGDEEEQRIKPPPRPVRPRRKANYTETTGNGSDSEYIDEADVEESHGGVLKSGELKALAKGVKDANEFRKLGEGVLSPPPTASPERKALDRVDPHVKVKYSEEEEQALASINEKRDELRRKRLSLTDKEKFLHLVRQRTKGAYEVVKRKEPKLLPKDFCGYDSRLSWADEEFDEWRESDEGKKALSEGVLGSPVTSTNMDEDTKMGDAEDTTNGEDESDEATKGICLKKRCKRHEQWVKVYQQDIRFEESETRERMRKLQDEEKRLRERAVLRGMEVEEDREEGVAEIVSGAVEEANDGDVAMVG
ncbi:MAG: hypothetical protein M1834_009630 [Cirrosporium novae-zelandiae]|nr:MAG: hypothetical protein M1834_009630 [Cirrosporium novae-zelandiae]